MNILYSKEVLEHFGLELEIILKHGDYDHGRLNNKVFYIRTKPVDEFIEQSLSIPEPIVKKIRRNPGALRGWIHRDFEFLRGRFFLDIKFRYEELSRYFGVDKTKEVKAQLPLIVSFRNEILSQIESQAHEWVNIGNRIASVLKVYYEESVSSPAYVERLFNELLLNPRLDSIRDLDSVKALDDGSVSKHIYESVVNGIEAYSLEKDELLGVCEPLIEKYQIAQAFVEAALLNKEIDTPEKYQQRNKWEYLLPAAERFAKSKSTRQGSVYAAHTILNVCEIAIDYMIEHELEYLDRHIAKCGRVALEHLEKKGLSPTKNTVEDWIREFAKKEKLLLPYDD